MICCMYTLQRSENYVWSEHVCTGVDVYLVSCLLKDHKWTILEAFVPFMLVTYKLHKITHFIFIHMLRLSLCPCFQVLMWINNV